MLLFLLFAKFIFCQNTVTYNEIGKQLFEIIKTKDTVSIKNYILDKKTMLEAIRDSKNVSQEEKKGIIEEIGREIASSNRRIPKSVLEVHSDIIKSGVEFNVAKYDAMRLDVNKKNGNFENIKSYNLTIIINYYEVKYEILTEIFEINNKVFMERGFKWENNK